MPVFIYSLIAYATGFAGLVYLILWMAGLVPGAFGGPLQKLPGGIWIWDLLLLSLFAVQHSVMARQSFKNRLTVILPDAAERSTYVLATGIVLVLMVAFWSPAPAVVWKADTDWLVILLWLLFAGGWSFCLYATFVINHFDLFGLRQAWLHMKGIEYTNIPFRKNGLYSLVRHPIQTGVLLGSWSTPLMTVEHFAMSTGITLYIFIGLYYEERDLVRQFGEEYRQYSQEVGGLVPRLSTLLRRD